MSNIIDYKDVLKYLTDNICSYDIEKQGTDKLDELLYKHTILSQWEQNEHLVTKKDNIWNRIFQ